MSGNVLRAPLRSALGSVWSWGLSVAAVLIMVFLLVPLLILVPVAFTSDPLLTWPPHLWSLQWFEEFFDSESWTGSLARSFQLALPAALLATALGVLGALGTAYARTGRKVTQVLFLAPLVLPVITYALGVYETSRQFGLQDSYLPVIAGQAMLAMPMVFLIASAALAERDPALPLAAASLGARWWVIVARVELPLISQAAFAGLVIAFATVFDEIIIAYFLLPPGFGTLPVEILASTRDSADPTIAAASLVVIAVASTMGALVLFSNLMRRRRSV